MRTAVDEPLPLTLSLHLSALEFARDHNVAFYRFGDCTIVNPFL